MTTRYKSVGRARKICARCGKDVLLKMYQLDSMGKPTSLCAECGKKQDEYIDKIKKACEKKKGYLSDLFATKVAIRQSSRTGTPLRVYQCDYCRKWHLTKQRTK